jgi:hypothetical protein
MTRQEYIKSVIALYNVANMSDSDYAEDWTDGDYSYDHCRAYEKILRNMMTETEYNSFINGDI